ncbi:hypothetical protein P0G10_18940 [Eubacteriales bacterium DFI.9.88]|nr:hypothetical protein [Eubacteriales bacterium DFI.9.88]
MKNKTVRITERSKTIDQAVAEKMKSLNVKFLGLFNPVPYEMVSYRPVLVPYNMLIYYYSMQKGPQKTKFLNRQGEIAIIFDANEVHGFHFDLVEKERFRTKSNNLSKLDQPFELLQKNCTEQEMEQKCYDMIRYKYLQRISRGRSEIKLRKKNEFYRPAVEMVVAARGKEMVKYAYLDQYALSSEHISGLKVRLDS